MAAAGVVTCPLGGPVIETVEARTYEGLPGVSPRDCAYILGIDQEAWKPGRAGALVHGAEAGTKVTLEPVHLGPNKGGTALKVKGNLPRLVGGDGAEALSLDPADVMRGLHRLISATQVVAPWAPLDLGAWKVSRVDANATAELLDADAEAWLVGVRGSMLAIDEEAECHGWHSHKARFAKGQVACYSKSIQTGARGPRDGHLVRIEDRVFGRKARGWYGDTLLDVAQEGADVARTRLDKWIGTFGVAAVSDSVEAVARLLMSRGMSSGDALKLAGLAPLMATKGPAYLVSEYGVSKATAYRWHQQLRDALASREPGVAFTWDEVVYVIADAVQDVAAVRS